MSSIDVFIKPLIRALKDVEQQQSKQNSRKPEPPTSVPPKSEDKVDIGTVLAPLSNALQFAREQEEHEQKLRIEEQKLRTEAAKTSIQETKATQEDINAAAQARQLDISPQQVVNPPPPGHNLVGMTSPLAGPEIPEELTGAFELDPEQIRALRETGLLELLREDRKDRARLSKEERESRKVKEKLRQDFNNIFANRQEIEPIIRRAQAEFVRQAPEILEELSEKTIDRAPPIFQLLGIPLNILTAPLKLFSATEGASDLGTQIFGRKAPVEVRAQLLSALIHNTSPLARTELELKHRQEDDVLDAQRFIGQLGFKNLAAQHKQSGQKGLSTVDAEIQHATAVEIKQAIRLSGSAPLADLQTNMGAFFNALESTDSYTFLEELGQVSKEEARDIILGGADIIRNFANKYINIEGGSLAAFTKSIRDAQRFLRDTFIIGGDVREGENPFKAKDDLTKVAAFRLNSAKDEIDKMERILKRAAPILASIEKERAKRTIEKRRKRVTREAKEFVGRFPFGSSREDQLELIKKIQEAASPFEKIKGKKLSKEEAEKRIREMRAIMIRLGMDPDKIKPFQKLDEPRNLRR